MCLWIYGGVRRFTKLVLLLLSYSVAAICYPYLRFNGNWINNDFVHLVPKLGALFQHRNVLQSEVSGNSLLYPTVMLILHELTGLSPPDLLRYAVPLTVGISVLFALYVFARNHANRFETILFMVIVTVSPLVLSLRIAGKHSVFSFSLFFLVLGLIGIQTRRKRVLLVLFCFALVLFHRFIAGVFLVIMVLYVVFLLTFNSSKTYPQAFNHRNQFGLVLLSMSLGWIWMFITSPSWDFERSVYRLLPPYPSTAGASGPYEGAARASSGVAQYLDVLTQRWTPWWVWLVLMIPTLVIGLVAFGEWLRSLWRGVNGEAEYIDVLFIITTAAGLFFGFTVIASLAGLSATNLIFRFMVYCIPIAALLIVCRPVSRWLTTTNIGVALVIVLVLFSAIIAPVKTSKDPAFQEQPLGIYTDDEVAALDWFRTHSEENLTVRNTINSDSIYYIELQDYRDRPHLPTTLASERSQLFSPKDNAGQENKSKVIYDSGRFGITQT